MANQKITVEVDVQSNTAKETTQAERLGAALKDAAASAQRIKVPAGATTGVGAVMARSQPVGAQAVMEYGQQRGTAGATGAAARDFARQSEGLGGLVRLYATYAANVYAVGAAFRALSQAMDTTNMIRGLDQIGASSGVALGGLSKQLVTATGGAISLREAMSATVKVTAAGLGTENVLRLGQVAAKASQALGVDMGDAINRLSRGITKLEPELLDELGIFTKIEPAVEKYAISVGKSASQLTDFERRQAFANAVLAEGEKKFAAIKVDANPYNKLAASLSNIAQSGLELVNNVLSPIVNFLSQSPTALILAIGAVASTILKQAVPAFGLFRENIRKSNEEANQAARQRAKDAVEIQQNLNNKLLSLVEIKAEKEVAALNAADEKFKQLKQRGINVPDPVQKVLDAESVQAITPRQLKGLDKSIIDATNRGLKEQAALYQELADTVRRGKAAEQDYTNTKAKGSAALAKDIETRKTIIGLNAALATSAEKASFKDQIVANTAYSGSLIGPINAIKLMIAELKVADVSLSKFSVKLLIARASMAAFAGAAATVGAALSMALGAVMGLITVGTLIASLFTNTSKESAATSEAFGQLEESTKNLTNTLENISKKPYLEQFNAESMAARTNALETFGSAIQKTNEAAQKELTAMNWLDTSVDFVKKLWGGDVQSKLNKEVAYGLSKAFGDALTSNSAAGKAAKQNISKILKIDENQITNVKEVGDALSKLNNRDAAYAISLINAELNNLGKSSKEASLPLQALDEGFKKITQAREKFISELIPKDSFSDFGRSLVSQSFAFENSLKNPESRLQAIKVLFEQIKGIGGIPKDLLEGVSDAAKKAEELQVLNASLNETEKQIESLTARRSNVQKELEGWKRGIDSLARPLRDELDVIDQQLKNLGGDRETTIKLKLKATTELEAVSSKVSEAQIKVFEQGAAIVSNKLSTEFVKAGATITKAIAGILPDTETGVNLRVKAETALIAAQIAQVKAVDDQIRATAENTLALKQKALSDKQLLLKQATDPLEQGIYQQQANILETEIKGLIIALKPGQRYDKAAATRAEQLRKTGRSDISEENLSLIERLQSSQATIANLTSQAFDAQLKGMSDIIAIQFRQRKEQLDIETKNLVVQRERLVGSKELSTEFSTQSIIARQNLENSEKELQRKKELFDIEVKLEQARKLSPAAYKQEIDKLNARKQSVMQTYEEERINKSLLDRKELITAEAKKDNQVTQDTYVAETNIFNLQAQQLDREQKLLDFKRAANILTEKDYLIQKDILALKNIEQTKAKAISDAAKERTIALRDEQAASERLKIDIEARKERDRKAITPEIMRESRGTATVAETTPQESEALKLREEAVSRINTAYSNALKLANDIYQKDKENLENQQYLVEYQQAWNTELLRTQSIVDAIAGSFGKVGSGVGGAILAIKNLNKSQLDYNSQIKEQKTLTEQAFKSAEAYDMVGDSENARKEREKGNKAIERAGELEQERRTDEIAGNAKALGSLKTMFKEKSAGYKAIGALEKTLHMASLAMNAQKMISDGIAAATSIGKSLAQAGAAGLNAITQALTLPPPLGFIAGAAMAAIVSKLLGKAFGVGSAPMLSKEQRQETQGTAMGYVAIGGKLEKQQVREGVLGAPDEKTQSISKALDLIAKNSEFSLDYYDKLLASFDRLSESINKAVAQIAGNFLRPGGLGINEGTDRAFFGLFKTITTINDSGIKLNGTLLDLGTAGRGTVGAFADVSRQSKLLGFNVKSSRGIEDLSLDAKTEAAIRESLQSVIVSATELGVKGGLSTQVINQALGEVDITNKLISLKDLKGDDLKEAYSSALSEIYDEAATQLYGPLIKSYRKLLESPAETAARVITTNERVNVALRQSDPSVQIGTLGFEVTEAIAESFGGLDKFLSEIGDWNDRFLTDQEKDTTRREKIGRLLNKYNIAELKDKDQYIKIVRQMIQNNEVNTDKFREFTEAGKDIDEVFTNLTDTIKEATDKLQTAYDKLASSRDTLKDIVKTMTDFKQSVLIGDKSVLTPGEKYLQTKTTFETTRDLAMSGNIEAIKDLPNVSTAFLEASRLMFSSSEQYTQDFNTVTAAIDTITKEQSDNLKKAEDALTLARKQYTELEKITDNTYITAASIQGLIDTLTAAETARKEADRPIVANTAAPAPVIAVVPQPSSQTAAAARPSATSTPSYGYIQGYYDLGGGQYYMETAATGSNYIPKDMPLYVHEGERLMPAADNRQLMRMVAEYNGSSNTELYDEVCRLTKQVETLTQVVADGAIMNAQATDRNTEQIATTIQTSSETSSYNQRLQNRTAVV